MQNDALPVPPHVVARVIQIAADPNSKAAELSKVIKMDSVLSTQILKSVNSAYYALRRKISSVDRAVAFMGIRAVRNLVLCLGVRELASNKSEYPLEHFWESSLRRAAAAKCLTRKLGLPDDEEVFTLGLCQDLGVLLLIQNGSTEAVETYVEAIRKPADARLAEERKVGKGHDEIGAMLFEKWEFPKEIIEPARWHHAPDDAPEIHKVRAKIAHVAEAISDTVVSEDKQLAIQLANTFLEDMGVAADELGTILDEVSEDVTSAAEMLSIKVGPQPSYQDIARQASQGLLDLNMSYQSLTEELQSSLDEQQRMAARLKELNQELEKRATTDELTGLPNRRAFDEGLARELERSRRLGKPVSLIMIDVDHFKKFNDTHGHQAGDCVLSVVGKLLKTNSRACDIPARYGGEEFAVILPHTPIEGAQIVAERLRKSIQDQAIDFERQNLNVTASFGVSTTLDPGKPRAAVMLMRQADDALYDAKEAGRNCVKLS